MSSPSPSTTCSTPAPAEELFLGKDPVCPEHPFINWLQEGLEPTHHVGNYVFHKDDFPVSRVNHQKFSTVAAYAAAAVAKADDGAAAGEIKSPSSSPECTHMAKITVLAGGIEVSSREVAVYAPIIAEGSEGKSRDNENKASHGLHVTVGLRYHAIEFPDCETRGLKGLSLPREGMLRIELWDINTGKFLKEAPYATVNYLFSLDRMSPDSRSIIRQFSFVPPAFVRLVTEPSRPPLWALFQAGVTRNNSVQTSVGPGQLVTPLGGKIAGFGGVKVMFGLRNIPAEPPNSLVGMWVATTHHAPFNTFDHVHHRADRSHLEKRYSTTAQKEMIGRRDLIDDGNSGRPVPVKHDINIVYADDVEEHPDDPSKWRRIDIKNKPDGVESVLARRHFTIFEESKEDSSRSTSPSANQAAKRKTVKEGSAPAAAKKVEPSTMVVSTPSSVSSVQEERGSSSEGSSDSEESDSDEDQPSPKMVVVKKQANDSDQQSGESETDSNSGDSESDDEEDEDEGKTPKAAEKSARAEPRAEHRAKAEPKKLVLASVLSRTFRFVWFPDRNANRPSQQHFNNPKQPPVPAQNPYLRQPAPQMMNMHQFGSNPAFVPPPAPAPHFPHPSYFPPMYGMSGMPQPGWNGPFGNPNMHMADPSGLHGPHGPHTPVSPYSFTSFGVPPGYMGPYGFPNGMPVGPKLPLDGLALNKYGIVPGPGNVPILVAPDLVATLGQQQPAAAPMARSVSTASSQSTRSVTAHGGRDPAGQPKNQESNGWTSGRRQSKSDTTTPARTPTAKGKGKDPHGPKRKPSGDLAGLRKQPSREFVPRPPRHTKSMPVEAADPTDKKIAAQHRLRKLRSTNWRRDDSGLVTASPAVAAR